MEEKYKEFLDKYIPSVDMREKLCEAGWTFSDSEKAAIIWNNGSVLSDRHKDLQQIADMTDDKTLCKQINERISYDRDAISTFESNEEGFVYSLISHEFEPEQHVVGYYKSGSLAYRDGCMLGFDFSIAKHQVIDEGTERIKTRSILSPLIEPDETKQIVEENYYSDNVAEIEFNVNGSIVSYWSCELPKERVIKVETLSNKRFENVFVVFPDTFEANTKVRIVGMGPAWNGITGWVCKESFGYDAFIRKATAEEAFEDYSDTALVVDYFDEERIVWDHMHIIPIYLEKVEEDLCNSFDNDNVIIGHDSGGAVWFRVVEVYVSERILKKEVKEISKEISVDRYFFKRVLKPFFIEVFDVNMTENKQRYTFAFNDEGRYLTGFEEDILEYNFFTYTQVERALEQIEATIGDVSESYLRAISGNDAIQLRTFVAHIRFIMKENPDQKLISVMS